MIRTFLCTAALVALAACAANSDETQTAAAPAAARDCFNVTTVSGYNAVDGDTVRISAGASRRYELDVWGPGCNSLDWTEAIAIETDASQWLCVGAGPHLGEIHFQDTAGRMTRSCQIRDVRRLQDPPAPSGS